MSPFGLATAQARSGGSEGRLVPCPVDRSKIPAKIWLYEKYVDAGSPPTAAAVN